MTNGASGAVSLRNLTKSFGAATPAVDDIDLDIKPGEFIALLGPSGSGKTTTLNMIAGFEDPTSGSIEIDGQDVAKTAPNKRGLGMVFQQYALFPHMRVLDNVMYPLRRRSIPSKEARAKAQEALELVGLSGFERRFPTQLSGGQQQRVAFARAVVFQPPVLLMDEPFGALDKGLRGQLQAEVARIHRELGSTFIFVTHDQEEAMALADRIAVFNHGKIVQTGPPKELYSRPATTFVAKFLGDSNLLDGELHGDKIATSLGEFTVPSGEGREGEVSLLVRPEAVARLPQETEMSGSCCIEAEVESTVYQGAYQRLICRTRDGGVFQVVENDGSGRTMEAPHLGDKVYLGWRVEDSHLVARAS